MIILWKSRPRRDEMLQGGQAIGSTYRLPCIDMPCIDTPNIDMPRFRVHISLPYIDMPRFMFHLSLPYIDMQHIHGRTTHITTRDIPSRHVFHCHTTQITISGGTVTPRILLTSLIKTSTQDLSLRIQALSRDILDHIR
jgi:hypothetical protein